MSQGLFDFEPVPAPPPPEPKRVSNQERFEAFVRAYPEMADAFARIARITRAKGHVRYSAKGLLELIRWDSNLAGVESEGTFKLNNIFSPYFARHLIEQDPTFKDFFETRKVRS